MFLDLLWLELNDQIEQYFAGHIFKCIHLFQWNSSVSQNNQNHIAQYWSFLFMQTTLNGVFPVQYFKIYSQTC